MTKVLENLEKYLLFTIVFLVPILILPIFANPFEIPKVALLIFSASFLLIIFCLNGIFTKNLSFSTGTFDLPVALLALVYLTSALIKTPNKMEAFLVPGVASVVFSGALIYFLLNQIHENKKLLGLILTVSAVLAGVTTLLAYSGILARQTFLPAFTQNPYFNLSGGYLPQLLMMAVVLPLSTGLILSQKGLVKKVFFGVCTLIIVASSTLALSNILPGKVGEIRLPTFASSWAVSVDALKTSPFWGVGPGNYLTAFNRLRPISYNQTELWPIRFSTAHSFLLTHLTETGLLGLAFFAFLIWQVVNLAKKTSKSNAFKLTALTLNIVLLFVFPGTTVTLFLFFVLLALNSTPKDKKINLTLGTLPILILAVAVFYFASRGFLAENKYKKALDALTLNDGKATYDTLREAIRLNPNVDRYHASYAQVTIALARGLAQKKDLTDADKNTIAQLIQQAIREAKATAALNSTRAANWEILGRTYQAVMPFAKGADAFAIQTFTQAVSLDPLNPNLRIALGGVYYALGNFDEAIKIFSSAVTVKNDLANAHYNLSAAYREKGEVQKSIDEMNTVLGLVAKDSPDYELAFGELDALKKRLTPSEESTNNLIPPTPAEKPVITPPLELPEDSNPPSTTQ